MARRITLTTKNHSDSGALHASSAATSLPAANLQSRQIAAAYSWRTNQFPSQLGTTNQAIAAVSGPLDSNAVSIGAMSLVNVARQLTSIGCVIDSFRVRLQNRVSGTELGFLIRPQVLSLTSVTNLTGASSLLAESPEAPLGTWVTPTNQAINSSGIVGFDDATNAGQLTLKSGANLQEFRAWVRNAAGTGAGSPTIRLDVYEGGVLRVTGATQTVALGTVGLFLSQKWNASALSTLAAANVQMKMTITSNGTSSVDVDAVSWIAEHASYTHDSGDIVPTYPSDVTATGAQFNLIYLPSSAVALTGVGSNYPTFDFSCRCRNTSSAAAGAFSAGRLLVAEVFTPATYDILYGWELKWVDPSIITETVGGQEWIEARTPHREGDATLANMLEADAYGQIFDILDRQKGITGEYLLILQPDNSSQYQNQTIYCRTRELAGVVCTGFAEGANRYSRKFTFKELR